MSLLQFSRAFESSIQPNILLWVYLSIHYLEYRVKLSVHRGDDIMIVGTFYSMRKRQKHIPPPTGIHIVTIDSLIRVGCLWVEGGLDKGHR